MPFIPTEPGRPKPVPQQLNLTQATKALFYEYECHYGNRRLLLDLQKQGYEVGRHQLRKIRRNHQLQAIQPRSFVPRTTNSHHTGPYNPNLLVDRPPATRRGELLVADMTYLALPGGERAYMAGGLDLFSRKVSG